jgi:hypothetical protein
VLLYHLQTSIWLCFYAYSHIVIFLKPSDLPWYRRITVWPPSRYLASFMVVSASSGQHRRLLLVKRYMYHDGMDVTKTLHQSLRFGRMVQLWHAHAVTSRIACRNATGRSKNDGATQAQGQVDHHGCRRRWIITDVDPPPCKCCIARATV